MKFESPLLSGTLIKRYKRFMADVMLENGETVTAHCANPGAMLGLKDPGIKVWLSIAKNPNRKLKYSWELLELQAGRKKTTVGINTSLPNKLVEEAILNGKITQLQNYQSLKREVKYGANSRIDILLQDEHKPACYVEVKNVHLLRSPHLAEFPDSVTTRGAKHLNELISMINEGHRAVMVYLIQRSDAEKFTIANDIDPLYAKAFAEARKAGVEMIAYKCSLTPAEINVTSAIEIM